jgi:hypothetical protein
MNTLYRPWMTHQTQEGHAAASRCGAFPMHVGVGDHSVTHITSQQGKAIIGC